MRKVIENQLVLGEFDISKIEFDQRSRDEMPHLLKGLQFIYTNPELREQVFALLEQRVNNSKTGRRGMDLWKILVMGAVRLNGNMNYDRLHDVANNHCQMRQMLGITAWDQEPVFPMQTIKDNASLLTPELLDEINTLVVAAGHKLVKKKDQNSIKTRCDSFVVETNVHYPTDANLLYDATRKTVELTAKLCDDLGLSGWRQLKSLIGKCKSKLRTVQNVRHSTSQDEEKKAQRAQELKNRYADYVDYAAQLVGKAAVNIQAIKELNLLSPVHSAMEIEMYIQYAQLFQDQIRRRVFGDEKIPHAEKVFSVFEPHTEWIVKGKAGISQELGLRVCLVTDSNGFTLHHKVMPKQTDSEVAVDIMREALEKFPTIASCSFDKGFWSPQNKETLESLLKVAALPKKGRLSKADKEYQSSEAFSEAQKGHSAVESAINAHENHGLDKCPDKGIIGFRRYVSLAVLSRNIQHLGALLAKKEKQYQARSEAIKRGLQQRTAA
ncbi:MAG: ISNCY family transposase [Victivallaceae bacterium]